MSLLMMQDAYGYTKASDHITWLAAYVAGYREPNYPVPAIRYEVVLTKTIVAIFNENNRYVPEYLCC